MVATLPLVRKSMKSIKQAGLSVSSIIAAPQNWPRKPIDCSGATKLHSITWSMGSSLPFLLGRRSLSLYVEAKVGSERKKTRPNDDELRVNQEDALFRIVRPSGEHIQRVFVFGFALALFRQSQQHLDNFLRRRLHHSPLFENVVVLRNKP